MNLNAYLRSSYDEASWGDSSFESSLYQVQENYITLGTISSGFDTDYYRLNTSPGYQYTVTMTSDYQYVWSSYTTDPYIQFRIIDSYGMPYEYSSQSGLYDDSATFEINDYGTYYVEVYTSGYSGGDYALTVEENWPTPSYLPLMGTVPINSKAIFVNPLISGDHIVGSELSASVSVIDADGITSINPYFFGSPKLEEPIFPFKKVQRILT